MSSKGVLIVVRTLVIAMIDLACGSRALPVHCGADLNAERLATLIANWDTFDVNRLVKTWTSTPRPEFQESADPDGVLETSVRFAGPGTRDGFCCDRFFSGL